MHIDDISRHLSPTKPLDWFSNHAPMQLAWFWTAQELWGARDFTTDARPICASKLKAAWDHVKAHRRWLRRNEAGRNDMRVRALMIQREHLENRPWGVRISEEKAAIDAQIEAILDSI